MGGFDAVSLQKYHWVEKINHVHHGGNAPASSTSPHWFSSVPSRQAKTWLDPARSHPRHCYQRCRAYHHAHRPHPGLRKVLDRAGLTVDDIDLFEINEAFASVVLKFQKDLKIPDEKLNVNGGAIAMVTRSEPPAP